MATDFMKTEADEGTLRQKRHLDRLSQIASYMNYLVTNHGCIVPQYGDKNDELAAETLQKIYDEVWGEGVYKCVGVDSRQVVYGGGNIHCITQQEPSA